MSTPPGDQAFLHELELNVITELTLAETGLPEEQAADVPVGAWLSDPADTQRYEAGLRNLLGAVEALEDGSGPGGPPALAEVPEVGEMAPCTPHGRHRRIETGGR